ncbi:MAG TPA: hypothetical protein VJA21_17860 [Verrucomicrobiae bacterium]
MKTKLLTLCLTCGAITAWAQGVVQFRTYYAGTTPAIDARVFGPDRVTPLDNSNPLWRAALIGGPTTGTPANPWAGVMGNLSMMYNPTITTLTWSNFRAPPNAGYVSNLNVNRAVPGVDWGGTALVQMVAWQGNYNTWAEAYTAGFSGTPNVLLGVSNPLILTLPSSSQSPLLTYLWGLDSFYISCGPCPEPGAFAFAALAAAALFLSRRPN